MYIDNRPHNISVVMKLSCMPGAHSEAGSRTHASYTVRLVQRDSCLIHREAGVTGFMPPTQ